MPARRSFFALFQRPLRTGMNTPLAMFDGGLLQFAVPNKKQTIR